MVGSQKMAHFFPDVNRTVLREKRVRKVSFWSILKIYWWQLQINLSKRRGRFRLKTKLAFLFRLTKVKIKTISKKP